MNDTFQRNELYWGADFQKELSKKHVVVVGLGGVGGYALDALARAGAGKFTLVDFDSYDSSNINRQLLALNSTLTRKKTGLFKDRLKDINPDVEVEVFDEFYTQALNEKLFARKADFVVDAIDTLRSKVELIDYCYNKPLPIISSLGTGNRINPEKLRICDISEFKARDSFAKNVVSKLKKLSITRDLPVVVSFERAHSLQKVENREKIILKNKEVLEFTKFSPSSTPFVPPVAGYLMASYIVRSWHEKFLNLGTVI